MKSKLLFIYIRSSGLLLLITALAKIISATSSAQIMAISAPIVNISYRDLFIMVGLAEFMVAICLLFGKNLDLQVSLLAWLSTNILIYRIGLIWVGYHKPCSCLGNLTDALHIPPQTADTAMKIILAYLLIGSYATLFWLWRQRRKASLAP
jgi:hypothetical protein